MLLLLATLALSAQTLDKYFTPAIPNRYFTDGHLNGAWWGHASPMERWLYLTAASDALGRKAWINNDANTQLTVPVMDVVMSSSDQFQRVLDCVVQRSSRQPLLKGLERQSTNKQFTFNDLIPEPPAISTH
jgi:hypothetical protein